MDLKSTSSIDIYTITDVPVFISILSLKSRNKRVETIFINKHLKARTSRTKQNIKNNVNDNIIVNGIAWKQGQSFVTIFIENSDDPKPF